MKKYNNKAVYKFFKANKSFIVFIILMAVFRSAVADWYTIPTSSMMPTIEVGDRITVNKLAYDLRIPFSTIALIPLNEPQRGEIIVFASKAANKRLIKRVIALPDDRVAINNGVLSINDKVASYHAINKTNTEYTT